MKKKNCGCLCRNRCLYAYAT